MSDDGFYWNGVWHPMSDQNAKDDDDGDAPGVREPRKPRPTMPAAGAVREFEPAS